MAQSISTLLKPTFQKTGAYGTPGVAMRTSTPASLATPAPLTTSKVPPVTQPGVVTAPTVAKTAPTNTTGGLVQTPTQPVKPPEPSRGLFGSVSGSLPKPETTPVVNPYLSKLGEASTAGIGVGERAAETAQKYGQEIARVGNLGAGAQAGALSTGTNIVGRGNAAIASQSASQRMQALAAGLGAELQGTEKQLSATGQQISGFGEAAGLAQPVQVAPGSALVAPTTGETIAGGIGGYVPYQTAEQVMSLIQQYPDAGYRYNKDLTPEQNLQLAQAAVQRSPSYQQSTFGAAGAGSFVGGQQLQAAGDLTKKLAGIESAAGGAEANFSLLLDVARRGGVNQMDVPILNTLQRNVQRGVTSNEAVANFQSIIQTVRSQYASIIGGGEVTVESLNEAKSIIPEDVSLATLESLAKNLQTEAQNRAAGLQKQINTLSGGQRTLSTGQNASAGGLNFDW